MRKKETSQQEHISTNLTSELTHHRSWRTFIHSAYHLPRSKTNDIHLLFFARHLVIKSSREVHIVCFGDVRRAKLYYLRGLRGKAAKIKEKRDA